jgi:hypothetical protein
MFLPSPYAYYYGNEDYRLNLTIVIYCKTHINTIYMCVCVNIILMSKEGHLKCLIFLKLPHQNLYVKQL